MTNPAHGETPLGSLELLLEPWGEGDPLFGQFHEAVGIVAAALREVTPPNVNPYERALALAGFYGKYRGTIATDERHAGVTSTFTVISEFERAHAALLESVTDSHTARFLAGTDFLAITQAAALVLFSERLTEE